MAETLSHKNNKNEVLSGEDNVKEKLTCAHIRRLACVYIIV